MLKVFKASEASSACFLRDDSEGIVTVEIQVGAMGMKISRGRRCTILNGNRRRAKGLTCCAVNVKAD